MEPVVYAKTIDVAGVVVAVHNIPGEGDVSSVPFGYLEVADSILSNCTSWIYNYSIKVQCVRMYLPNTVILLYASTCSCFTCRHST